MIQNIIIGLVFLGALFYVGRMLYKNMTSKEACSTGCSKCGAMDLAKIKEQLKERGL